MFYSFIAPPTSEVSPYCMCQPVCGGIGTWGWVLGGRELSPRAALDSGSIIDCLLACLAGGTSEDPSEEHDASGGDGGAQQSGLLEDWHPLRRLSGNACQPGTETTAVTCPPPHCGARSGRDARMQMTPRGAIIYSDSKGDVLKGPNPPADFQPTIVDKSANAHFMAPGSARHFCC